MLLNLKKDNRDRVVITLEQLQELALDHVTAPIQKTSFGKFDEYIITISGQGYRYFGDSQSADHVMNDRSPRKEDSTTVIKIKKEPVPPVEPTIVPPVEPTPDVKIPSTPDTKPNK
jgi:hypothetical protein